MSATTAEAEVQYTTGLAFRQQRMLSEAVPYFRRAIHIKPEFVQARYALGKSYLELEDYESALKELQNVVRLQPDHVDALNLLGVILLDPLKRPDVAERTLRIALRINPDHAGVLVNLGNVLVEQERSDEASVCYGRAIEVGPQSATGYNNLGALYQAQNRIDDAIAMYTAALAVEPDHENTHWNWATALLTKGEFEKGWAEFEWRPRDRATMRREFSKPRLSNQDVRGKTVYVYDEQGIGDSIQFCRFLPALKGKGASVILECHQGLGDILKGCEGTDAVVERNGAAEPSVEYDFHIPLLSLPFYLGVGGNITPASIPYVRINTGTAPPWLNMIPSDDCVNVGIVWAGSPHHKGDRYRSCTLADFAPLGVPRNVRLFSLQKGEAALQLSAPPAGPDVIDLGKHISEFRDTAQAIAALDLIVSVDTSVVHLAGAMGKPVWTILPFVPDWRWLLDRDDTPWYPTMRLFRQHTRRDWKGVMTKIVKALEEFGNPRRTKTPNEDISPDLLRAAMAHHRNGERDLAEPLYRQVLHLNPDNATALHLLGLLMHESGNHTSALELILQSIDLNPLDPDLHADAGKIFASLGNRSAALEAFRKSLRLNPGSPESQFHLGCLHLAERNLDAAVAAFKEAARLAPDVGAMHKNLGVALLERRDYEDAETSCREAVRLLPEDAEAYNNLGNVLKVRGKTEEAMALYGRAIHFKNDYPEAHYNLGVLLMSQKNDDEALGHFETALRLKPSFAEVYNSLGNILKNRRQLEASIDYFRQAIHLKPDLAVAHNNLGSVLLDSGMFHEAEKSFREALRLDPRLIHARNNLGNALRGLGDSSGALDCFRTVLEMEPPTIEAHFNMAATFADQHRFDESIESYDRAIAIKEDYTEAHLNKAMVQLLLGQLPQAWDEYEWRLRINESRKDFGASSSGLPAWNGARLDGKTILVHYEQGFGDTIQFARYFPLIKERGGTVLFECQKELSALLKGVRGIDEVIAGRHAATDPAFHAHVPLLSLPQVFRTTLESIPWSGPYIEAPVLTKEHWRKRFPKTRVNVGVVWAGNPSHKNDYNRSLPFSELEGLTRIDGVRLFSLQKGEAATKLHASPVRSHFTNLGEELTDFCDTAAVIDHLDVVISVDTAVAHLAGAMGKKVWVLLPYAPDWRWLLDRTDTPWYPTMRLFRQSKPGDWKSVVGAVTRQLTEFVTSSAGGNDGD